MADTEMYERASERTHVGDEPVEAAPALEEIETGEGDVAVLDAHPAAAAAVERQRTKPREPKVHKYLKYVIDIKASDLHFKSGAQVHVRHKGDLKPIKGPPLSPEEVEKLWFEIMNDHQKKQLLEKGASDFAYQIGDSDRFRVNIFRQRGSLSVAARRVNKNILNFDELYLPKSIYKDVRPSSTRGFASWRASPARASRRPSPRPWTTSTPTGPATSSPSRTRSSTCSPTAKPWSINARSTSTSRPSPTPSST